MDWQRAISKLTRTTSWREFVTLFLGVLAGTVAGIYVFILLLDPYNVVPFSLPIDRRIVSIADRFMYPQIVRSKRFDSLIIGTSTSRLLDPEIERRQDHERHVYDCQRVGIDCRHPSPNDRALLSRSRTA